MRKGGLAKQSPFLIHKLFIYHYKVDYQALRNPLTASPCYQRKGLHIIRQYVMASDL